MHPYVRDRSTAATVVQAGRQHKDRGFHGNFTGFVRIESANFKIVNLICPKMSWRRW